MFSTKNDLPNDLPAARRQMIARLNLRPADSVTLRTQAKQTPWNVQTPHFTRLHWTFDEVLGAVPKYIDLIAERAASKAQFAGVEEKT